MDTREAIVIVREIYSELSKDKDLHKYVAVLMGSLLTALINEGFSREEALQVLMSMGSKLGMSGE